MPCGAANIVALATGTGRANSASRRRSNGGSDDTRVLFKGKQQTGAVLSGHDLPGKVGQSTLQGPQQVQARLAGALRPNKGNPLFTTTKPVETLG